MRELKRVCNTQEYKLYVYKPSCLRPFYNDMEPLSFMRRIRFLIELFYGYSVYYLEIKEQIVGYCTVSSGANKRYWFANDSDIIFGPYFIREDMRGKGYSEVLLKAVLYNSGLKYDNAYDYININNVPSIKVTEKIGGKHLMNVDINIVTRRMKENDLGQYRIYQV